MLVDDEPDILTVFKSYLASEGYLVEAFSDSVYGITVVCEIRTSSL